MIWTVLSLYLTFMLTSSIPAVQVYAGRRVSRMLSGRLGTSVSIKRIDVGLINHLTLYDLLVKDQSGRDMLSAGRVSALDLLPLAEGTVSISSAQLFDTFARLYQRDAMSQPNFQFALDSLASRDTTSQAPLNLRVNSLIVRRSRVSYNQLDAPATPGVLNPKHIDISGISAHIVLKTLTDDSLNLHVKRLSLREKSGLDIRRMKLRLTGGRHGFRLSDFLLHLPQTRIQLHDIQAAYLLRDGKPQLPTLSYSGRIASSTVTPADLSFLLPTLTTFQSPLTLRSTFLGKGETLQVPELTISSEQGDIDVDIMAQVRELSQPRPIWHTDIRSLVLSANTVNFISENLRGKHIDIPEEVARLGSINMKGTVSGRGLEEISARQQLMTDAGNVDIDFDMSHDRRFKGHINTSRLNLERLLDNSQFGTLSAVIELSGQLPPSGSPATVPGGSPPGPATVPGGSPPGPATVPGGSPPGLTIAADGMIEQFVFNGYDYQNINIKGQYSQDDIRGHVSINDPHIALTIEGAVIRQRLQRNVRMSADIRRLSPKAINLSAKWNDAVFSGTVAADFTARDLNDAVGTIDISNLRMRSANEDYELRQLHVASGYTDEVHYLNMQSDFGDIQITGAFDHNTLLRSFSNFVADNIPTLPVGSPPGPATRNDFTLSATIRKSDWIESLLRIPLRLARPLTLSGMLNDNTRQLFIECEIPQFYYDDSPYRNGHISLKSPSGALRYEVSVDKLMDDGDIFDLKAYGSAQDNRLLTTLEWKNHSPGHISGTLSGQTTFEEDFNGQQTVNVSIAPSVMRVREASWDIHPCLISYTGKRLDIRNFNIQHGPQHLRVNGAASQHSQDSLMVDLQDIDIDYVLDLVNFHAVDFNGYATGKACLSGLFGHPQAAARLRVAQFEFQHGRMGVLDASVEWNNEKEQIDIHAKADDGPEAATYINGYVSPTHNFIDLAIRAEGTRLDFAHSFTETFIDHIEGHANGQLRLAGPLDAINLTGDLLLNGKAHVSTLNCTYELRDDSLHIIPNEIAFTRCPVYDTNGNQAMLTGGIHHQDLTNLTYDIFVDTDNLLAYDFNDFGEDTFYGTVYANGHVGIHGRDGSLLIEADVTPQPNSVFVYNAASPDAVSSQEFIHWGVAKSQAEDGDTATESPKAQGGPATVPGGSPPGPATDEEFQSDLTMQLKINVTPNATIRLLMDDRTNDYITLRGNGEIQTTYYNKGGFNMFGTYRITEGSYGLTIQNIIRKNFTFREGGTVVFSGDPYDAALNLQAMNTVNGVSLSDLNVGRSFSNTVRVNCLMNISGQPRQPIVDFDLEMPNVNADEQQMVRSIINSEEEMNQQVVYLLAVGRFYPQGANNAADTDSGQSKTSLAMQSLLSGTLSGQINNVLGQVIKSNNWNFGANISTGDEGWNNAEYEGIISGRLLNNRLLINGQFGYRDNATTATPSFIGDFDIRYLLFPNGNLALKVYNQSNDRYFTKSSLNTQGLGVIMKKDFNGLQDLLGNKRKKKPLSGQKK